MMAWLLGAGVGPAAVGLPVNWAGGALAGAAQRWFRRLRRTDDLSRLVRAATGSSADLTDAEFGAVRHLLEDEQTWVMLGRGTVEDLAARIASCLPPRAGRAAGDSQAAGLAIARGLLEFAVADLDPRLFQQVLLARLRRMEAGQASALDESLLGLHADLASRLTTQGELAAERFAAVTRYLRQIADRLPPGPAQRDEVVAYLTTLIGWLNTDPWPRDRRFDGPVLTPAAIERKLRVTVASQPGAPDIDADSLAGQCRRLVVLGGPGSGKTWLARRMARRCAEHALEALAAGESLDEVELPLFTTCSRLFSASGGIREAAVSSALSQTGDLGGTRLSTALRRFFTERNAPTLLVIDSLDEARGSSDRLRQADTLPWRVVLTTRPSSWNHQLHIDGDDDSHRVGELRPLRYPDDIEPFITRWFAARPERGRDLARQIASRQGLQRAATVPLILALYCIVGGSEPLPEFRHDLYARVLKRILTGRWRGQDHGPPDVAACHQTLRAWAWSGAVSHPVSGIGTWADEIPAESCRRDKADDDALDHVAALLGPADVDTGMTLRRFIHRSIREYLVAEHVAGLPASQAAEVLLPHLWYDPDWEYAAPAAIAMHPDRDQLLRDLICQAANSDEIPADLSVIDAGLEFRGLLARIAAESGEASWSPELLTILGQATFHFGTSARIERLSDYDRFGDLDGTAPAPRIMSRQARGALLDLLASRDSSFDVSRLVDGLVQLAPLAEGKREAREALLRLLDSYPINTSQQEASTFADGIARLDPSEEDKQQACEALLRHLEPPARYYVIGAAVDGLARLDPSAEDRRRAHVLLFRLLEPSVANDVIVPVVDGLARLGLSVEDRRRARAALLKLLHPTAHCSPQAVVDGMVRLAPLKQDRREAGEALLGLLTSHASLREASVLADGIARLNPSAEDKQHAREALLRLLTSAREASALTDETAPGKDRREAREALLGLLTSHASPREVSVVADGIARLAASAEDAAEVREALSASSRSAWEASVVADGIARLAPSAEDKQQAREALLGLLTSHTAEGQVTGLARGVARLDPSAEDRRQAREALLRQLVREVLLSNVVWNDYILSTSDLVDGVVRLARSAEDKSEAREVLLGLLASRTREHSASDLARGVARLDPSTEDRRQAREALFGLAGGRVGERDLYRLLDAAGHLGPTEHDTRRARELLLRLLGHETENASAILRWVTQLDPTVHDLSNWHSLRAEPTAEFLAAVRRNSRLVDWLGVLPSLAPLAGKTRLRYRWRPHRPGKGNSPTLVWDRSNAR